MSLRGLILKGVQMARGAAKKGLVCTLAAHFESSLHGCIAQSTRTGIVCGERMLQTQHFSGRIALLVK
jgi:hypothetical protein